MLGRGRALRVACLTVAAGTAVMAGGVPTPAAAGVVSKTVAIEIRSPVYPDARAQALEQAMIEAVRAHRREQGRAAEGVGAAAADSSVSYIDVLSETVEPGYYAIQVAVGIDDPSVIGLFAGKSGPLPTVRSLSGHAGPRFSEPSGAVPRLVIRVPLGPPAAMAAYRTVLASLDVRRLSLRNEEDGAFTATVELRHLPASMPEPPPDSGLSIQQE